MIRRMQYIVPFIFLFPLTCIIAAHAETSTPLPTAEPPVNSVTAVVGDTALADLVSQAKAHYDQRETPGEVAKAIDLYKSVLSKDPNHFAALWRLARCYWWEGDHASKDKQIAIYDSGKIIAQRAQKASPDQVESHYWYGVCEGRASEVRGILSSLFAVDPMRKAMEKTLSLDPNHGSAHHVLGVLYRKAPGWPLSCGDINKSLKHARMAVEFSPDKVLPRVGLAKTLIAKGQKDEARKILEEALALPGPADLQPETKKDKQTAEEILASLQH